MYFKIEYTVKDLFLDFKTKGAQFNYGGKHQIAVTLRPPTKDELKGGYEMQNAFCSVMSQQEPNPKVKAMFLALSNNQTPMGSKYPAESMGYITRSGKIKINYRVPLKFMPDSLQSFCRQIEGLMLKCLKDTVKLIRWRNNKKGPHNPFIFKGAHWSFDGRLWYPMPSSILTFIETSSSFTLSDKCIEETIELTRSNIFEPLSHELYREAWSQRHENPRSALIIGLAAAEVGFKHCLSTLVPHTQWIIENVPSPPLIKMIQEYLPKLPTKYNFNGKALSPPDEVIDDLKKGVQIRNKLVHTGNATVRYEFLEKLLLSIKDILWMLDYYCGFEWALNYIRPETKTKLKPIKK